MIKRITAGLLLLFLITALTRAQSAEETYLKFDYIKVAPANTQQYMEYMSKTWKPLYQKRVESGNISSWSLYRVSFPGGERSAYNFIVITTAGGLEHFETIRPRELLLLEQQSREQVTRVMKKANELRTIMYSEVWKEINRAGGEKFISDPKYLMMDYMKVAPGKDYHYQMLEDEYARPIHQERMDNNEMQGWKVFSLVAPGGTEYGYNYATGNYFDQLKNVELGFTEDVIENALPGTNIPDFFNTIFSTRDLVNSEIWELVDRTSTSQNN